MAFCSPERGSKCILTRQSRLAAMRGHKKLFPLYRANQRSSLDIVSGAFEDGQQIIETWKIDHNTQRPHTPFGGLAPAVCANLNRATRLASLELRKGSTKQVMTATQSRERHRNVFYIQTARITGPDQMPCGRIWRCGHSQRQQIKEVCEWERSRIELAVRSLRVAGAVPLRIAGSWNPALLKVEAQAQGEPVTQHGRKRSAFATKVLDR